MRNLIRNIREWMRKERFRLMAREAVLSGDIAEMDWLLAYSETFISEEFASELAEIMVRTGETA